MMQRSLQRRPSAFTRATIARLGLSVILLVAALSLLPRFTVPDIAQDYAAAWGWWQGIDSNAPTDRLLLACCQDLNLAADYPRMQTAHPPFTTLITLPLALLSYGAARIVWCLIAWACIVWGWQRGQVGVATCAATAGFWLIALVLGTHEPLMFALLISAITLLDRAPNQASVLVGLCVALKVYPALLLIGLWLSGRRRAAIVATMTATTAMLGAELVLGIGGTAGWLRFMPINTARYVDTLENGSLVRLVREIVPGASPMLVATILVAGLVLPLIPYIRRGDGIASLVPVMLLASPLSWRQYMGLVGMNALGRVEQACLTIAGVVALLIGLNVLPGDNLAPLTQTPLLITLLLLWYRMVRSGLRPVRGRKELALRQTPIG